MNITGNWMEPAQENRRFMAALGIGLLIELSAVGLLLPSMTQQPPPAQQQSVVKITVQQPPPPKPKPPTPKPPPPKPVVPPKPMPLSPPPPKPVPRPVPAPPKPPPPVRHVVQHYVAPPRPVTPPPPVPVLPSAPSLGQVDAFRVAMRNAVQSVANQVYPQAAQMAQESGTPEVNFIYRDGVVADITLARSSGYPLLDNAAMQAARIAHYPPPPKGFAGRTYTVTIAVIFQMAAQDISAD